MRLLANRSARIRYAGRKRLQIASIRKTPCSLRRRDHALDLAGVERERLLAQDVFAGGEVRQGVGLVPGVRRGDVHRIHVIVAGQRGVIGVAARHAETVAVLVGPLLRTGRDCDDLAAIDQPHRLGEANGDAARPGHSPAHQRHSLKRFSPNPLRADYRSLTVMKNFLWVW